jgi:YD repeat-containing protein
MEEEGTPLEPFQIWADREYVHSPGYVDEYVAEIDVSGQSERIAYVLQDANYNVLALVDADGDVLTRYVWDPYGQLLHRRIQTPQFHSRIGHQGLFFDRLDELATANQLAVGGRGLYQNRNRTYDPVLGRFRLQGMGTDSAGAEPRKASKHPHQYPHHFSRDSVRFDATGCESVPDPRGDPDASKTLKTRELRLERARSAKQRENVPGWIRTTDLRFRRPLLCPAELPGPGRGERQNSEVLRARRHSQTGEKEDEPGDDGRAGRCGTPGRLGLPVGVRGTGSEEGG